MQQCSGTINELHRAVAVFQNKTKKLMILSNIPHAELISQYSINLQLKKYAMNRKQYSELL